MGTTNVNGALMVKAKAKAKATQPSGHRLSRLSSARVPTNWLFPCRHRWCAFLAGYDPAQQQPIDVVLAVDHDGVGLENETRFSTDVYALPDDSELTPCGTLGDNSTLADRVIVAAPGVGAANDGKLQVRRTSTATRRPQVGDGIPNLRYDMDQFHDDRRVGGASNCIQTTLSQVDCFASTPRSRIRRQRSCLRC
jgi:hypothetical protein